MALDYLILYEHIVREYDSLMLLKAELERRGRTVEIRQLLDRKKLKYFTCQNRSPERPVSDRHTQRLHA